MIERFEKFLVVIAEIDRCWHKIAADEMEKYGLKGPYAMYFTTLYRFPEGITAAQLGEFCGRDKSDVSRAVSVLEKEGIIRRDGRNPYRALIVLTEKGQDIAGKVNKKVCIAVQSGSKGLTEEQRTVFYQSIDIIAANLKALSKEGLPEQ